METKELFSTYESEVRSYCRNLPAVFTRAKGSKMYDDTGKEYLDFFDGAGALNYGHNNEYIKKPLQQFRQEKPWTKTRRLTVREKQVESRNFWFGGAEKQSGSWGAGKM